MLPRQRRRNDKSIVVTVGPKQRQGQGNRDEDPQWNAMLGMLQMDFDITVENR